MKIGILHTIKLHQAQDGAPSTRAAIHMILIMEHVKTASSSAPMTTKSQAQDDMQGQVDIHAIPLQQQEQTRVSHLIWYLPTLVPLPQWHPQEDQAQDGNHMILERPHGTRPIMWYLHQVPPPKGPPRNIMWYILLEPRRKIAQHIMWCLPRVPQAKW
jgi:hypothetical protein